MGQQQYASGCIDDMAEGGGLPDDFDFTLTEVKTENFDFGAEKGGVRPCLKVVYDGVGYDDPIKQYYSVGKSSEWLATPDGKGFKPLLSPDQQFNINSNLGKFVTHMGNGGYPTTLLKGGDFTVLTGLKGHAKRFLADNIPDGENATDKRGNPKKNLFISLVTSYPGMDGKAVAGAGAGATVGATADDKNDEAVGVISALLKSNPGGIAKADLPKMVFDYDKKTKLSNRNAIVKITADDSFLSDGPWAYDGGVVKSL